MNIRFGLAVVAWLVLSGAVNALEQPRWPLVFTNSDEMRPLGLMLVGWGSESSRKIKMFKYNCYYYGDGGNTISLTENFYASFRAKGFSVNSLCLALQSSLAFDSETGMRLPSYQVVHRRILTGGNAEDAGDISEVLPIVPPTCFKRGLPYHDCTFNYDVQTGKRLSAVQKKEIATARVAIDAAIARQRAVGPLRSGKTETMMYAGGREAATPYLALLSGGVEIPKVAAKAGVTQIDVSKALPLGYGYQLFTDGAAGPEGGDPELARDKSRRASEEKIRTTLEIVSDGGSKPARPQAVQDSQ